MTDGVQPNAATYSATNINDSGGAPDVGVGSLDAACSVDRPPWNTLGGLVAAVGIAIAVAAFVRFRQIGTTVNPVDPSKASRLVTDGIFRVSRNPMYLGLLLLLIGWAIWLGSVSPWLVPPLFVVVITWCRSFPRNRRSVAASGTSIFRIDEAWRGGLAGVGDAILDQGRSAPAPILALTAHLCPPSAWARMRHKGTNGALPRFGTVGTPRVLVSPDSASPISRSACARTALEAQQLPAIDLQAASARFISSYCSLVISPLAKRRSRISRAVSRCPPWP